MSYVHVIIFYEYLFESFCLGNICQCNIYFCLDNMVSAGRSFAR